MQLQEGSQRKINWEGYGQGLFKKQKKAIHFKDNKARCNRIYADPVAARSEARTSSARTLDRGFEFRLGRGCLSLVYVVLSCAGTGFVTG
jgi:hypothetical protein